MRVVGIKELKNKLSEYVRLVTSGETVLVTDRDRVVAELIPPREERATMVQDVMLAAAVREGWLTPAVLPVGLVPPSRPVAGLKVETLLAELAADRDGR